MRRLLQPLACLILTMLIVCGKVSPVSAGPTTRQYDEMVQRLDALTDKESAFGPLYQPIYHAMLSWYRDWGGKTRHPVDTWMTDPTAYAGELADALEHDRNFIAEHPGAGFPLVFDVTLPGGKTMRTNYTLNIPAHFDEKGKTFPLVVGLHGSGWLAHRISFTAGGDSGGRCFFVTPINEGGPWKIDFLNAYLDELIRILPIDKDHIYVEGHSLGAMATWDWAMSNPDRFAAISPRDGNGAAFRAARLKNLPVWVIHGGQDDSILPGYADQMVSALQAAGGTVKYMLIQGAPHNLPPEFKEEPIVDWYLQQTRSTLPVPADPLDSLGLGADGFSRPQTISMPDQRFWKSMPFPMPTRRHNSEARHNAEKALFMNIENAGQLVRTLIQEEVDPRKRTMTLYLAIPPSLDGQTPKGPDVAPMPARQCLRFYYRGDTNVALGRAAELAAQLKADGKLASGKVWITELTPSRREPDYIAEYRLDLK